MKQNHNWTRRMFLFLALLLLGSLAFLALEYTSYMEGSWQLVQGQGLTHANKNKEPFTVEVPQRGTTGKSNWAIVREGLLFFKALPVEETVVEDLPAIIDVESPVQPVKPIEPPKPTCPLVVAGIMRGKEPTAILVNKSTQMSQTAKVGTRVGDFEVVVIEKDYILVRSSEADFKLELGGI